MSLNMRDSRFIIILLAITAVLFFFRLGDMALTDPDETFYAQTAREMLDAGQWATPRIFGEPQFEKPVLYYWLVMASYIVFGVGAFAARFPSAVFGVIGVLGVFFLGKRLYSPLCGFLSGVIVATSVEYLILARACVTDMVLTVFIIFLFLFFIEGWFSGKKIYFLLSAVMAALATLTKGPIGVLLPGLILFLYLLITRQIKDVFKKVPVFSCILVFLAVAVPWYLIVKVSHGGDFFQEFYGKHHITRFLHPEHRIGSSPFFYLPIVIGGIFPWTIFFLMAAWEVYKKGAAPGGLRSSRIFLAVWFLAVFIFFSISRTKLVTYIFPLFPAMAIMTGRFWEGLMGGYLMDRKVSDRVKVAAWVFMATSVLMGAGAVIATFYKLPDPLAVKGAVIASLVFAFFAVLSLIFILREKAGLAFWSIALSVIFVAVPVTEYIFPVIEHNYSMKGLTLKALELAGPGDLIGGECDHKRGVAFFSGRTDIVEIHPYTNLKKFYQRDERVWGVTKRVHYDLLRQDLGEEVPEPVASAGKYVLMTNRK